MNLKPHFKERDIAAGLEHEREGEVIRPKTRRDHLREQMNGNEVVLGLDVGADEGVVEKGGSLRNLSE